MLIEANQVDLPNRRKLLDALRINGRMARVELAAATGLSPATVTATTAELMRDGYIEASNAAPEQEAENGSKRGRPRVDLQLRPDAARVAGVKISMHRIVVSITDFVGQMLGSAEISVRADRQAPEVIVDMIDDALEAALRSIGLRRAALDGVGVGLPGYIDGEAGVSHWSPVLGGERVEAAALFTERLGLPCFVDNDANLATLAEQWFGRGRGVGSMVVVTIEHGVGMGIVVNGRLYRGAGGVGAEFGHVKIRPGGALCRCGQRGCIEAYLADYAILREVGTFRALGCVDDPIAANAALAELQADARGSDERIATIYARAGDLLGVGLANLVNIFAPELLVVTGAGAAAADLFEPSMRRAFEENVLNASSRRTRVEVAQISDTVWARGAAAVVLERSAFGAR